MAEVSLDHEGCPGLLMLRMFASELLGLPCSYGGSPSIYSHNYGSKVYRRLGDVLNPYVMMLASNNTLGRCVADAPRWCSGKSAMSGIGVIVSIVYCIVRHRQIMLSLVDSLIIADAWIQQE